MNDEALALWKEWFELDGSPLVYVYDGHHENESCFFCEQDNPTWNGHADNCVYIRAKALVKGPQFKGLNIDIDELDKINAMEE